MTFVDRAVTVRTPASSANLGPGFDALGLALTLTDELTGQVIDTTGEPRLELEITGEGVAQLPRSSDHLVVRAMNEAFDLMGEKPPSLRLSCTNTIPHGRGLGSSSAAIVGGIVLARALVDGGDERLDDLAAYQLATDLEGHPDNVAAALFGGFTIAWIEGAAAAVHRMDVEVPVTVFVPPSPVSTSSARGLLPEMVAHGDAIFNVGRAALLVAALTGSPELLTPATEDRLHQGFRSEAMPDSYRLLRSMRVEGIPAIISGAGPSVLAFGRGISGFVPDGWRVLELDVSPQGARRV